MFLVYMSHMKYFFIGNFLGVFAFGNVLSQGRMITTRYIFGYIVVKKGISKNETIMFLKRTLNVPYGIVGFV